MTYRRILFTGLCLFLLSACDDDRGTFDAGPRPTDSGLSRDAAAPVDSGTSDAGPVPDAGPRPDSGTTGGGVMQGNVTRTGTPAAGGVGNLYIAVFTSDPVLDREGAMNVGNALLENVDMSGDGASIPYTITGIPPRSEPYFVTAFLDDNNSVTDPNAAAPDRGDLVALDGLSSPQVTIADTTPVTRDLVLNFNLPF